MNTYHTSDGERLTQSQIDYRVGNACKKKLFDQQYDHGYNFCEECGRSSGTYFDCSHTISRKKAKDDGMAELCYDLNNIRILCRICHKKHDNLELAI